VTVRRYWLGAILITTLIPTLAIAINVGDTVSSVQVRDANNNPASIPDIGNKVISLFYTDPDVKDQNEKFREDLKARKFDQAKYRGMGVANLKDTWKPNFIIRKIIRGKMEKFKSLILTDTDHTLKNKWNLGDCNEKDVVLIIGKDKKVKYFKAGPMSEAERKRGVQIVADLLK
jgi:predicted transcriptional regulator